MFIVLSTVGLRTRCAIREEPSAGVSQDRVAIYRREAGDIVVLADGAGGIGGGGRAASMVVEAFRDVPLHEVVRVMHSLDAELRRDANAGESTAIVVALGAHAVWGASVGDSEAWLVRTGGGNARKLTGAQERRRLGSGRASVVFFEGSWDSGQRLLVASDGLYKYALREQILAAVARPGLDEAADALLESVRLPSGALRDDLSLALLASS